MNRFRFLFFFSFFTINILSHHSVFAQENKSPKELFVEDKLECFSIPTEIDGLEYNKSIKCISKDSICYIIQGFAMSCIPRSGNYPAELPNLNPKPNPQ
ncbi:MAG: hypothetical protein MUF77_00550 [Leptospira sp.]|nr:hypothetical protein [Leptospira sp.]